ncbi:hypothetical protein ACHRVZ_00670 [Flavobacterium sp. FlaQc-57]|uniref:hypothetical protein n=1 Tax=Flavobacterium sp. FlaQc-57 TaxID=3374186 RepID=UPI003757DA23
MTLTYKRIFLIDSVGALLSAFLLGIVLVRFQTAFGMPRDVLYFLAIFACVLAVYSCLCCLFVKENWKICLKIIGLANIFYSFITLILVLYFYKEITNLGLLYFLAEIAIIVVLAKIEIKKASPSIEN